VPAMKIGGAHEVAVGATAERCMAIILDVPAYREWWPGVTESEVLSAGEQPEVRLVFDSHAPGIGAIELLARLEPRPPSSVGIGLMGGRLKKLTGPGWTLTDDGGAACRVRYEIQAEMDTGMPGFMEKPFAEPAKRFLVTEPVEALKRRAES
jgi:ribosome-associated toxin RatA of RatAB toxin-antitoxin module